MKNTMVLEQMSVAGGVEFELEQLVAFNASDDLVEASCSGCKGCAAFE